MSLFLDFRNQVGVYKVLAVERVLGGYKKGMSMALLGPYWWEQRPSHFDLQAAFLTKRRPRNRIGIWEFRAFGWFRLSHPLSLCLSLSLKWRVGGISKAKKKKSKNHSTNIFSVLNVGFVYIIYIGLNRSEKGLFLHHLQAPSKQLLQRFLFFLSCFWGLSRRLWGFRTAFSLCKLVAH